MNRLPPNWNVGDRVVIIKQQSPRMPRGLRGIITKTEYHYEQSGGQYLDPFVNLQLDDGRDSSIYCHHLAIVSYNYENRKQNTNK